MSELDASILSLWITGWETVFTFSCLFMKIYANDFITIYWQMNDEWWVLTLPWWLMSFNKRNRYVPGVVGNPFNIRKCSFSVFSSWDGYVGSKQYLFKHSVMNSNKLQLGLIFCGRTDAPSVAAIGGKLGEGKMDYLPTWGFLRGGGAPLPFSIFSLLLLIVYVLILSL